MAAPHANASAAQAEGRRLPFWVASGGVALAVAVYLAETWAPQPQIDDAFITYRYAENLVRGDGLVWIAGQRVEAITNLLWALCIALGGALGLAAPDVGHALGVACGAGLLMATAALAVQGVPPRLWPIAALAPWVVLASPALPYFATSGMETHGFLLLAVGTFAAHAHGRVALATAAACLALVMRPDAGILAVCWLAVHVFERAPGGVPRAPIVWLPPAAVAGTIAALTLFRLGYYGSPVPNTFFAKVGGIPLSAAMQASFAFLVEGPLWLIAPAILAARSDRRAVAPLATCGLTWLYVVSSGGTAMTFSRFLLPLLPLLAALAARGTALASARGSALAPLWAGCVVAGGAGYLTGLAGSVAAVATGAAVSAWAGRRSTSPGDPSPVWMSAALAVATALVVGGASLATRGVRIEGKRNFDRVLLESSKRSLVALERTGVRAGQWVGATAIGVVGYYGPYRILDLLGLAEPAIARHRDDVRGAVIVGHGHVRSNVRHVLERRPEVLLIAQRAGLEVRALPAVRALWEHPRFDALYRWDARLSAYRLRARARTEIPGGG